MASTTPNYNLRKPAESDRVNVALDIAGNMDILDSAIAGKAATNHAHSGTYVPYLTATGVAATDTAALQAAITAAVAGNNRTVVLNGAFKVNASLNVLDRGVALVGQGEYRSTSIEFSGATSLFELGTDNGHAYDASDYDGLASGFRLENIALSCATSIATTALANGQGNYAAGRIAIRDWRGGDVVLRNVVIQNFDYPFWGIQSDVNRWDNVQFAYAHSGAYLGPRSDQLTATALYGLYCDRLLDLDRINGARFYGCQFVGNGTNTTNPIKIHSAWSAGCDGISFDDCWFEHFQGYSAADSYAFVEIGVGDSVTSQNIVFRNPIVLTNASGTTPRKKYLVTMDRGDSVTIEDVSGATWFNLDKLIEFTGTTSPSVFLMARNSVTHTSVFTTVNNGSGSPSVTNFEWGALGTAGGINIRGGSLAGGGFTIQDAGNIVFGTGTGSKIGTSTSQKFGFWNATPVAKQTVSGSRGTDTWRASLMTALSTIGLATDSSTFDTIDPPPAIGIPYKVGTALYYFPQAGSGTSTDATLGFGTVRVVPVFVPRTLTITRIGAEVTSGGTAGNTFRIGIWNDNNGQPGTLNQDCGTIDAASATVQEITVNFQLTPGIYWVGGAVQGATTQPTMRTATNLSHNFAGVTAAPSAGQSQLGYTDTQSGAFTTFTASPGSSGKVARIHWKAQA